ncbi:MAG: NAD-dependent protein deacetylase [Rubricoccaceae bacterium]
MAGPSPLDALTDLLEGRRIAVLAGAGISTDSGIPDYRGPATRHIERRPIQYDAFVSDATARCRYWARASRGWERMASARPNAGHVALATLEASGHIVGTITQNVDGLHQRAGAQRVIELHGSLADVCCLQCERCWPRDTVQERIEACNPGWTDLRPTSRQLAPDGDVEVDETESFVPPTCPACEGSLKPDVVFFGESVPKPRVEAARRMVSQADALLVVGSSLTVYSGYRFVRQAETENTPIAIVTLGATRGHRHAAVTVDAPLGEVLPELADRLNTRIQPRIAFSG